MCACGSGAAVQPGQAQVRLGADHDKAAGNHRPQRRHVHFGAEPQKDSVRTSAVALISGCNAHPKKKLLFVQLTLIRRDKMK